MTAPAGRSRLFDSLRRLLDTTLSIGQVRLQLLGTELEQEKLRVFRALLTAAFGLLLLGTASILLAGLALLLFWDRWPVQTLALLVLLYAGSGAWLLARAGTALRAPTGGAFALSLGELQRDRDTLGATEP